LSARSAPEPVIAERNDDLPVSIKADIANL
jgi:hypothetical protein